jgi:DNA-binding MarR family transcriptional regulator
LRFSGIWLKISTSHIFNKIMQTPLKLKSDYINVLLDTAAERTRERGSRVYEIELGVSLRDLRLLRTIGSSPGISMGQLLHASAIEKTLGSKLVGALVRRGLVMRQIGVEDARQIHLFLTESGVELVLKAEPLGKKLEARLLHCLNEKEIQMLTGILQKLIANEAASRVAFEAMVEKLINRKSSAG